MPTYEPDPKADLPAYRNPHLPVAARVADLLTRMTAAEKVAQLCGLIFPWGAENFPVQVESGEIVHNEASARYAEQTAAGIGGIAYLHMSLGVRESVTWYNAVQRDLRQRTRLGIPALMMEECCHGHLSQEATSFPLPVALAASFDPDLVERVFTCVGRETRVRGGHVALSPNADLGTDPRWGRVEETFGESPWLVSRMATAAVRGLQGGTLARPDFPAASPKHYAGFAQSAGGRQMAPAELPERLLRDQVLPSFRAAVQEGGALALMPAYIEIDGLPCHANRQLLRQILREEWDFTGVVISDFGGVPDLFSRYHIVGSELEAGLRALQAGVDMDMPLGSCYTRLVTQMEKDSLCRALVESSVTRVLTLKFALGLFDEPDLDPGAALRVVHHADHQATAQEAAEKCLVLLKNEGGLLPLQASRLKRVALIGPHSKMLEFGGVSPHQRGVNILDGLREFLGAGVEVLWAQGCALTDSDEALAYLQQTAEADFVALRDQMFVANGAMRPPNQPREVPLLVEQPILDEAVALAQQADVAILCLGESSSITGENFRPDRYGDRAELRLVGNQLALLEAVKAAGVPVVVVLIHGRALELAPVLAMADAVLDAWNIGEMRGPAVARALFGAVNPGGKLPVTIPCAVGQLPHNQKALGFVQLYAFQQSREVLPFGYGLSYTTFTISAPRLMRERIAIGESAEVEVEVSNTGTRAGDEVVQVYVTDMVCSVSRPLRQLKSFRRLSLEPGETRTVRIALGPDAFTFTDEGMQPRIEPGAFEIAVGSHPWDVQTVLLHLL